MERIRILNNYTDKLFFFLRIEYSISYFPNSLKQYLGGKHSISYRTHQT